MDDAIEVKLMMEGGRAEDLHVRRLRLEEGLCRLPTAEISLVSERSLTLEALEDCLELPAALEISRSDLVSSSRHRTTRWFSGIVTSVEHDGRILLSSGGSVYAYRMTISPDLVNLTCSHSNFQWADVSPKDAVERMLGHYGVEYAFVGAVPAAATAVDGGCHQRGESDYAFLLRILASCGLSFSYRMPRQAADGKVSLPTLQLGRGTALAGASEFARNGLVTEPLRAFSCDREFSTETYRRMDSWRMRKSIGVDRVEFGLMDDGGADAFGSAEKGGGLRRIRENASLPSLVGAGAVGRVTAEYLKALSLDAVSWQGRTSCLEAMSGCRLTVRGFYDRTGGAGDVPVEALVVATVLDGRLPVPSNLVGDDVEEARFEIALSCLDGKAVNDDLGDSGLARSRSARALSAAISDGGRVAGEAAGSAFSNGYPGDVGFRLLTAVVSVRNEEKLGKLEYPTAEAYQDAIDKSRGNAVPLVDGYMFYAGLLDANGRVAYAETMKIHLVLPVGGFGQGLFHVPRIGDRILVAQVGQGVNYLYGYLPGKEMPFSENPNEATNSGAKNAEMTALRFRTVGTKPDDVKANTVAIRRKADGNACSELAFYNTHVGRKWTSDGKDVEEPLTASNAPRNVLANFQSTGNMQLSANHNLEISAKNLTFKSPGRAGHWSDDGKLEEAMVSFDDLNRFVVAAKGAIVLKVGNNSIEINNNGISIKAGRWTSVPGPLDASISMNALSGVNVNGLNCRINGFMSASISDTIGASASFNAGTASVSGGSVSLRTLSPIDFGKNAFLGLGNIVTQMHSLNPELAKGAKTAQSVIKAIKSPVDTFLKAVNFGKKKEKNAGDCLTMVLETVQFLIDETVTITTIDPDWQKTLARPAAGQGGKANFLSVRDAFDLSALCCKVIVWVTALKAKSGKAVFCSGVNAGPLDSSSLDLKYGRFSVKSGEEDMLAKAYNEYSVPVLSAINQNQQGMSQRIQALEHPADGRLI